MIGMEETPQVVEALTVQPDEPDSEATCVGSGRHCSVSVGGLVIVVVFDAGVEEPEAFGIVGIAGPKVALLRVALAASPVEVAILVLEV